MAETAEFMASTEERLKLSKGMKVVLFLVFIAVWLGLAFLFHNILPPFRKGGWGMWPILAVGIVSVVIIIDRIRYLYRVAPTNRTQFTAQIQKYLLDGDVMGAVAFCRGKKQPLPRIVSAGLSNLHRPDQEVQDAVDEMSLAELPKVEIRTGYLAMIGNISTLLGLLGTIVGLIKAFAGVSLQNINDPATMAKAQSYQHMVPACQHLKTPKAIVRCIDQNKATILAAGISEAMNCTAFGLGVGIFALLGFSVLNGRTNNMLDDISESTVYLLNLAVANRKLMRTS
jgi:biopolymer transport protein ExbB/TolQ